MIMKTAICCIAKCENRYLHEWVSYHLALGFSQIFIWDNNNPNGEHPEDVLADFSQVTVLDCRGEKAFQNKAYTKFYNEYGKEYDWIAYIDVDEFITFSEGSKLKTIDEFLNRYDASVQIVHLNWMCYGDDDIVGLDRFDVVTRFLNPLPFDKHVQYDFPENNHVKSIIRGGIDVGDLQITVHTPREGKFVVYDADGKPCPNDYFHPYTFQTAYIRHYVTKTIDEWLAKISRGRATLNSVEALYPIEKFFIYNAHSIEKDGHVKMFLYFMDAFRQSDNSRVDAYKYEVESYKKSFELAEQHYRSVLSSKAYKLGNMLLKPFKKH